MMFRKILRNRKGFTLVELMVVVVIIGILAAIAVPVYNNSQSTTKQRAVEANLRIIDGAIMQFQANTGNTTTAPTIGTVSGHGDLVPDYIATEPTGPDGVTYGITEDAPFRATVSKGTAGDWFTPSTAVSLPISWEEE